MTNGTGPEIWGTTGDADAYDVAMVETTVGGSRHYIGTLNVTDAGVYRICIYEREGASPANTDMAVAQGVMYWDGTEEISLSSITTDVEQQLYVLDKEEEAAETVLFIK